MLFVSVNVIFKIAEFKIFFNILKHTSLLIPDLSKGYVMSLVAAC